MKYFLLTLVLVTFYCCESDVDEDMVIKNAPQKLPVPIKEPTPDAACLLCQMDLDISDLQNHASALYHNPNRQAEMKRTKVKADSLNKIYSDLIKSFGNDIQAVQKSCAKKYNFGYVKDTAERNALLAAFYVWYHNATFPTFDTVGYTPVIKNGMYEVQDKGKTNIWNKQQHEAYLRNGLANKAKTTAIYDKAVKSIASKLTGTPENKIDRVCLYVLGYLCLPYQSHPVAVKYAEENKEFTEYIKIQKTFWAGNI